MMDDPASENNPGSDSAEEKVSNDDGSEVSEEKTELTPEEQMAQYEEALKDEDWGHQPC